MLEERDVTVLPRVRLLVADDPHSVELPVKLVSVLLRDGVGLIDIEPRVPPLQRRADGLVIRVAPTADQAYTLIHRYFRYEPVLSADGDTPLVPEVYSQAVIEWAAYQALTQGNSVERADRALRDFRTSLARIKDNANQGADPLRISNRPGGWL